jgi:hypothetical protein
MTFADVFGGGGSDSDSPLLDDDTITQAASEPRSATVDGVTVQQHPLGDLIAADKYLKGQAAAKTPSRGLRFTKLIPPGAVSGR